MSNFSYDRPFFKLTDNFRRELEKTFGGNANRSNSPQTSRGRFVEVAAIGKILKNPTEQATKDDLHRLACAALLHVGRHGDVRIITQLIASTIFGKSELKSWFVAFGPISFDEDDARYNREKKTRLGEALEMPFWRLKPSKRSSSRLPSLSR